MESTPSAAAANPNAASQMPPSFRPGNYDRAWNDPPLFSVEVNAAASAKPVPTKLNKRVAYPGLSSNDLAPAVAVSATVASGPLPPLTTIPPTKVDFIRSFSSPGTSPDEDDQGQVTSLSVRKGEDALEGAEPEFPGDDEDEAVKQRLLSLLEDCLKREPLLEDSVATEVKKRLEIMTQKWDSLPSEVKVKLNDLVKFLEAEDFKAADSVHLALTSDCMPHCGQWIMGLKQIIRKHL